MDFNFQPQRSNLSWNNLLAKNHLKSWCKYTKYLWEVTENNKVGKTPGVQTSQRWEIHWGEAFICL